MTIVNSFTTMWYTLGDILVLTKMREFLQRYKKPKLLWNWLLDTIVNYSWQRSGGRLRRGHMSDLIKKICFCTADFSKDLFLPRHRKKPGLKGKVYIALHIHWVKIFRQILSIKRRACVHSCDAKKIKLEKKLDTYRWGILQPTWLYHGLASNYS